MRFVLAVIVSGFAVSALTWAADDLASIKDDAVRQYDQGNYDEALKTLHDLDNAHVLDGPLVYRLFFCEKTAGHEDDARKALERARQALEAEFAAGKSLEVAFYLANTYANLARSADAKSVAHDMTAEIESGRAAKPKSAIGLFQLGKLYQDQARPTEASSYYAKAVEAFDLAGGRYAGNARWALRYLGNSALSRSDFASAESSFARLTSLGGADAADWDVLAAARVRLAKYGLAAEAWRASVKLDPANGDDARYAARLADTAAAIAPLPLTVSGGTAFTAMAQADLEATLKSRGETALASQKRAAEAVRDAAGGQAESALEPKLRAELAQTLKLTRREFVAAGLEYVLRHYPIRDTAFREGYAVLVFQDRAWELPADPGSEVKAPTAEGS